MVSLCYPDDLRDYPPKDIRYPVFCDECKFYVFIDMGGFQGPTDPRWDHHECHRYVIVKQANYISRKNTYKANVQDCRANKKGKCVWYVQKEKNHVSKT